MGFNMTTVAEETKGYLRQAGLQQGAKFIGLTYIANENWEGMDIELQTADGRKFTERTFGPNIDKVFPKALYQNNVQVGVETKEQAFERVENEIGQKLFYLALCFTDRDTIVSKVSNCPGMKELVDKVNLAINQSDKVDEVTLNFLTIWKNNKSKLRSNLIIADKIKWIEPTVVNGEGHIQSATIKLSTYQANNCMIEQFPYNGSTAPAAAPATVEDAPF